MYVFGAGSGGEGGGGGCRIALRMYAQSFMLGLICFFHLSLERVVRSLSVRDKKQVFYKLVDLILSRGELKRTVILSCTVQARCGIHNYTDRARVSAHLR